MITQLFRFPTHRGSGTAAICIIYTIHIEKIKTLGIRKRRWEDNINMELTVLI